MTPDDLIAKYRRKGILIDTNLLVLFVVGIYGRAKISAFHRTRQYRPADFDLLVQLIDAFDRRVVTPHVLAEVDNLARQLPRSEHPRIAEILAKLVPELFEVYSPSAEAVQNERFPDLGLTDSTIIAASNDVLVVTDDFRLSSILSHLGRDAININHLRTFDD